MFHVRDRGIYNLFNGTDGQTSELWVQTALRKKCKLVFCFVVFSLVRQTRERKRNNKTRIKVEDETE